MMLGTQAVCGTRIGWMVGSFTCQMYLEVTEESCYRLLTKKPIHYYCYLHKNSSAKSFPSKARSFLCSFWVRSSLILCPILGGQGILGGRQLFSTGQDGHNICTPCKFHYNLMGSLALKFTNPKAVCIKSFQ